MKFVLPILFLLFNFSLFAQEIKVSDKIDMRQDNEILLLGKYKGKLLFYRDQYPDYFIQSLDENMHFLWEKKIKVGKRRSKIISSFGANDNFYTLSKEKIKKKNNFRIFKFNSKAKVLDSINVHIPDQSNYINGTEYILSENKNYAFFFTEIGGSLGIQGFLLDLKNFKLSWINKFSGIRKKFGNNPFFFEVTNNGVVYFIQSENNRKSRKAEHQYNVYRIVNDQLPKPFSVSMEGKQTYDISFKYDNLNQQLIGAGLFSEKSQSYANGTFFVKINDSDNSKIAFQEFDIGFVKEYLNKKRFIRQRITDSYVKELISRKDGGIIMVCERVMNNSHYKGRTTNQSEFILKSNDFSNIDIFITSFHPTGEIHWKKIIHKKQYSYNDGGVYSSFFLAKTPSELRIIFNDEIKTETTVSDYQIDILGNANRNSLLNTKYHKLRLLINESIQTGSSEIIIPSLDRKILKLVKIQL